jgi:hypothetical protein
MRKAFKLDFWVFHFYCGFSAYHVSFNLPFKTQESLLSVTRDFLALANDNRGSPRDAFSQTENRTWDRNGRISLQQKSLRSVHYHQILQIRTVGLNVLGAIMTIVRKICIQSKLPHGIWPCIISHATLLLNRVPVQRKKWQPLLKVVHRRKPNLSHSKINTGLICSST